MYESRREELIASFRDREYRESYAEDFLNTSIATQLRVLREQRELTQAELAEAVGTKQTAISRIENVNNTARNIGTLLQIAFNFGCRLKVSFETFGTLIDESLQFSRANLQRPDFAADPVFHGAVMAAPAYLPGQIATYPGPIGMHPNVMSLGGTETNLTAAGSGPFAISGVVYATAIHDAYHRMANTPYTIGSADMGLVAGGTIMLPRERPDDELAIAA